MRIVACSISTALLALSACRGMEAIDAHTERLLRDGSQRIGAEVSPPVNTTEYARGDALSYPGDATFTPETVNPKAGELAFTPMQAREAAIEAEARDVLGRLEERDEGSVPVEALEIDIIQALLLAQLHAREYRTAEEDYILAALRLLIERHQWGPRFFDEVSANATGEASDGAYESSLQLVNELGVTQRLPYGGEVSARMLARATEDLREFVAGEEVQTAEMVLSANLPLLRGAGLAARESRIQAERDLIYAARDFEDFRRAFLVDIATQFLGLVVQQRGIGNAERQLVSLREEVDREIALVDAGRSTPFDRALIEQQVLFGEDDLRSAQESYRLAVDRFKVRLGLPVDDEVVIIPSSLGLPTPETNDDEAVRMALAYRLDLQTQRDQVTDSLRTIDFAANDLLPDLDFAGSFSIPTDSTDARDGLRFNTQESSFAAGITFGLPLDREIERLNLRQAQIAAEQSQRDYTEFRDNVVVDVRDAVREIGRSLFSLELQEENIRVARLRLDSIEAAPERAEARDKSDALNDLTSAENGRDTAVRDLEVAILAYLLNTGTLRVRADGTIEPLAGMELQPDGVGQNGAGGGGGRTPRPSSQ